MAKHRGIWPLTWMCETLDVSRGRFYAWLKRPPSLRARTYRQWLLPIRAGFAESDSTYGARRVWLDLRAGGIGCGLQRVERLMRANRLPARPKHRRLPGDTGPRPEHAIAPNVLDRRFEAPAANC